MAQNLASVKERLISLLLASVDPFFLFSNLVDAMNDIHYSYPSTMFKRSIRVPLRGADQEEIEYCARRLVEKCKEDNLLESLEQEISQREQRNN